MRLVKNNLKKTISSSGINFLFRIFGLGSSFLIVLIISRFFSVSIYGNYALTFTLAQASSLIFSLGLPNALILIKGNKSLDINESKSLLLKGSKIVLLLSIVPFFFFYFGANTISTIIFHNQELVVFFKIVGFSLPFLIIHELFLFHFIAIKRFYFYNLFMFLLPNLLLILFLLIFYYYYKTGYSTFLSYSLSIFIVVIIEFIVIYESKLPKISKNINTRELLKTATPMLFSGLLLYLLNWTDIIMLGIMVDEKQVGIYNIAYKIGTVGFLVIVSVSTIITPKIAELYGKGNIAELKNTIQTATRLIAFLSIPLVGALILFKNFILSFFGPEALMGSTTMIIISLGVLFSAISGNVDQILNMTNNQRILRNITLICFLLNVLLNVLLIPIYGIEGAAFASLICNVAINLLCLFYIKRKLGFYTLF